MSRIHGENQLSPVSDFVVITIELAVCECCYGNGDEIGENVGPCKVATEQESARESETEGVDVWLWKES